jgi:inorganic pyrophosphatase
VKRAIEPIEVFDKKASAINAIVDTPKNSRVKYAYSGQTGSFRLERLMPEGMAFPFNYGFIPLTIGKDGDPMDIIMLNEQPIGMGCLVKVRILAVIEAEQTENEKPNGRNDKLVGTVIDEETPPKFLSVQLDEGRINQMVFFFTAYNKISGKTFKALRTKGPKDAEKLIREGIKKYTAQQTKILSENQ